MTIEIGQIWQVHSHITYRWTTARVIAIQLDSITLAYDEFPQTLSTDQWTLNNAPHLFRPMPST